MAGIPEEPEKPAPGAGTFDATMGSVTFLGTDNGAVGYAEDGIPVNVSAGSTVTLAEETPEIVKDSNGRYLNGMERNTSGDWKHALDGRREAAMVMSTFVPDRLLSLPVHLAVREVVLRAVGRPRLRRALPAAAVRRCRSTAGGVGPCGQRCRAGARGR